MVDRMGSVQQQISSFLAMLNGMKAVYGESRSLEMEKPTWC